MSENTNAGIEEMSYMDQLGLMTQTYDQAIDKYNSESGKKYASRLEIKKDGTYDIRVLPLAPIIKDGKPVPGQRQGYEYPVTQLFVKIKTQDSKTKKSKTIQIPVIDVRQAYPDLKADLIETFVKAAKEKYPTDEDLIKKLGEGSYNDGLKFDRTRVMYVLDLADVESGIKQYSVSYSQFREIEDAKFTVWNTKRKKNPQYPCPLTDPKTAYPLQIKRETSAGNKTKYSFTLNTADDQHPLTEEIVKKLFDLPRLPEMLYTYRRYHLGATIEALKQFEDEWNIDVLSEPEVKDCIKAIEAVLPSDDTRKFSLNGKDSGGENEDASAGQDTLDDLWDAFDAMAAKGIADRSPEGSELKGRIVDFIERNNLSVKPGRKTGIEELLNMIEDELSPAKPEPKPEPKPARGRFTQSRRPELEPEPEPEDDELEEAEDAPESDPDPEDYVDQDEEKQGESEPEDNGEDGDEEESEPASNPRHTRNDDTNEPAARPARERRRHGANRR